MKYKQFLTVLTLKFSLGLLLSGILVVDFAHAQELPRPSFLIGSDFVLYSKFNDPPWSQFRNSKVQTNMYVGEFSFPVIFDHGQTMLLFDLIYKHREFYRKFWPEGFSTDPTKLYEANMNVTFRHAFSSKWYTVVRATPGLASDLQEDISSDDFRLQAAVIVGKPLNNRWSLGFGVAYSNTFGEPLPIPLLVFDWNDGGKWRASGMLPSKLELWYQATQALELGLVGQLDGNEYHMGKGFPADNPQVQYISATFGLDAIIQPLSFMSFGIESGLSLQIMRLMDGKDEIKNGNYDLKPGLYIRSRLKFMF